MNSPSNPVIEVDEELSQAKTRIAFLVICLIYLFGIDLWTELSTDIFQMVLTVLGLFGVYAFTVIFFIKRYPGNYPVRRVTSIIVDISAASAILSSSPEYAIFYPLYLWIIIGNGIRFGVIYLFIAMAIGTTGFTVLINLSSFWSKQNYLSYGLLIGCFVLPIFFVSLIRRLHYLNSHLDEMVLSQTRKLKNLIEELELANNRTNIATQVSGIGIWELNLATDQMLTDKITTKLLGIPEDSTNFTFEQFIDRVYDEDQYLIKNAQKNLVEKKSEVSIEYRYPYSENNIRWHKIRATTIVNEKDEPVTVIGGILDITEQKENEAKLANYNKELEETVEKRTADLEKSLDLLAEKTIEIQSEAAQSRAYEAQLKHMALHDMLTSLPNRTLLNQLAEKILAGAKRYHETVAVMFIDLDGFKAVNDNNNHEVGDAVLVETSLRISGVIREIDIVSRIGGDEFIVLLPKCQSKKEVNAIAKRILKSIAIPFESLNISEKLSASIGVAIYPDDSEDWNKLVRFADNAMYQSKVAGKNQFMFHQAEESNK